MTEYTSIRVPVETKEIAEESKLDDETWENFIQRCADTEPSRIEVVPKDDVDDQLADLQEHAFETTSRLGKIEQTLDELQAGRR
jgi:hypothetical protein